VPDFSKFSQQNFSLGEGNCQAKLLKSAHPAWIHGPRWFLSSQLRGPFVRGNSNKFEHMSFNKMYTFMIRRVNVSQSANLQVKKGLKVIMAKITFRRSGGFIGQGMRVELNLNNMPISAVRNITRLVEEAQFFDLPENLIKSFKPDEYQYTITVDAGITNHTVRTNDSTMPSSLRPLVKELFMLSAVNQEA
jgi:hypothetical protein